MKDISSIVRKQIDFDLKFVYGEIEIYRLRILFGITQHSMVTLEL